MKRIVGFAQDAMSFVTIVIKRSAGNVYLVYFISTQIAVNHRRKNNYNVFHVFIWVNLWLQFVQFIATVSNVFNYLFVKLNLLL